MAKHLDNSADEFLTGKKKTQIKPGEQKSPGRPKGSKNRKTVIEAAIQAELVDRLGKDAAEIYEKAAQMAKEGDRTMIKLFLNRLLPELKASGEGTDEGKNIGGVNVYVNAVAPTQESPSEGITINYTQNEEEEETNAEG